MKKNIMGLNIDDVTIQEAIDTVYDFTCGEILKTVYTPNAEIAMTALEDKSFRVILNKGDLVIPDGAGVVLASKLVKNPVRQKTAGYDLVLNILKDVRFKGKTFFLLGAKPKIAELAVENIKSFNPNVNVIGTHHGFFEDSMSDEIINKINKLKPDILFVGLGAPRQEKWIDANKHLLKVKVAMGVGGTIDGLAGVVKRAPSIFIKLNLEWFYRLIKQPARIKRMIKIPVFLFKALTLRSKT